MLKIVLFFLVKVKACERFSSMAAFFQSSKMGILSSNRALILLAEKCTRYEICVKFPQLSISRSTFKKLFSLLVCLVNFFPVFFWVLQLYIYFIARPRMTFPNLKLPRIFFPKSIVLTSFFEMKGQINIL